MANPIKVRLNGTGEPGLFHDSRKDVKIIAKVVNMLIDKVNELIEENNRLRKMIEPKNVNQSKQTI